MRRRRAAAGAPSSLSAGEAARVPGMELAQGTSETGSYPQGRWEEGSSSPAVLPALQGMERSCTGLSLPSTPPWRAWGVEVQDRPCSVICAGRGEVLVWAVPEDGSEKHPSPYPCPWLAALTSASAPAALLLPIRPLVLLQALASLHC